MKTKRRALAQLLLVALATACTATVDFTMEPQPDVAAEVETAEPEEPAPEPTTEPDEDPEAGEPAEEEGLPEEPETAGAAGAGDTLYPQLGNGGFDVTHYTINLTYLPDQATPASPTPIEGITEIEATATQDLSSFSLDFDGLEISVLSVDDDEAEFSRVDGELIITPDESIASGSEFTVIVVYSGSPTTVDEGLGIGADGWKQSDSGVFVAGEPTGASGYFPVNDHPTDKATYTISLITPSDLTAIAVGVLETEEELAGDQTLRTYEMRYPMASYLLTLAIGDLVLYDQEDVSDVDLRHAFSSSVADEATADVVRLPEAIEFFESIFGNYPFDSYGHLIVDAELGFALETQGLSIFDEGLGLGFGDLSLVHIHELGHQWFGNWVSLEDWSDIWLNEGFATYSEQLWLEYDLDLSVDDITGSLELWSDILVDPPGSPTSRDLFAPTVYYRGAMTLHALRLTVGDDVFFEILREWVARFGGGSASTQQFIDLSEELSGQDLQDLFQSWLYEPGVPEFPQ